MDTAAGRDAKKALRVLSEQANTELYPYRWWRTIVQISVQHYEPLM